MKWLYTLGIRLYYLGILSASLFNNKAEKWIRGREKKLQGKIRNCIWFHCSSLGEFEQGRPLIEKIRTEHPGTPILLSFFSPSGFEIRENYPGADEVVYLPLDTKQHAQQFLDLYQPIAVFFVKYEFWYFFLHEIQSRKIPCFLVSARFRRDQIFFKSGMQFFRNILKSFTLIFTQDLESIELLKNIDISTAILAGDTRFDRVTEISADSKPLPYDLPGDKKILVAGSTWPEDERLLISMMETEKRYRLVIAPHQVDEKHILHLEELAKNSGLTFERYSSGNFQPMPDLIIIDSIGLLSRLYRHAYIAYVGGGFGSGIHNILEAAVYRIPVIFGPRYTKFAEAHDLLRGGNAFSIRDKSDLKRSLDEFSDQETRDRITENLQIYFNKKRGATEIIYSATRSSIWKG